jgi:predicted Rossmann fold flavoprotein
VFPASQDAHTIINCFLHEARRHGVLIKTQHPIQQLDELADYNYIAVTTGGSPRLEGLRWLSEKGIVMEPPVPSLFTFRIDDKRLQELMGTVVEEAVAYIPGTKLKATGPLLITHWGMSGPAILKLSSYAARELHEQQYQMPLAINWICRNEAEVEEELHRMILMHPQKQLATIRPFNLPSRLWSYLLEKVVGHQAQERWQHIGKKDFHRLVNVLINDTYAIAGRAAFKDEFVTCGGVSLTAVNLSTLSSKLIPNLYFAGEVLDIDGITGGFNFQAAWTTAYTVAKSIYNDATTR